MPFKSEAQRKYLWANEPKIARDWTDTYGSRIQKAGGQLVQPGIGRPGYGGPHETEAAGRSYSDAVSRGEGAQHRQQALQQFAQLPTRVSKPQVQPDRGFYDYGKRQIKKTPSFLANVGVAKKLNIPYLLAAYGTDYIKDKFQNRDKGTIVPSNQLNEMGMMSGIKNIGSTISDAYKDWKSIRDTGNLDPNVNPNITLSDPNTDTDTDTDTTVTSDPTGTQNLGVLHPSPETGARILSNQQIKDNRLNELMNRAEGGRIGYQMGNMVGAEMEGAEIEGAEMEGAMMQSQEVIKELYDALIAQGLSPQAAIEKIKQIIASTQTQEPQSPMMGEEFPGQEFGRAPAAFGGIMDTYTGRRKYGLGSKLKKLVKKSVSKLKDLASSKIGKLALMYAAGTYLGGTQGFGGSGYGKWFGKGALDPTKGAWKKFGKQLLSPMGDDGIANIGRKAMSYLKKPTPVSGAGIGGEKAMLAELTAETGALTEAQKIQRMINLSKTTPAAKSFLPGVSNKALAMIGLPSVAAGLYTAKQPPEELGGEVQGEYDDNKAWWDNYLAGLDSDYSVNPSLLKSAQGGRVGRQEGGLMDLGGMEKDYRNDGGFVPIGGQEKADDVPARLSRNEFVFTADAVRNAGGGDIDRGAEVMENVMKNLEGGGRISDESQGQGAQEMFETSERLSEVI